MSGSRRIPRTGGGDRAPRLPLLGPGEQIPGGEGDDPGHGEEQGLVARHGDKGSAESDGNRLRGGDQGLGGCVDAALQLGRGEALGEGDEPDDDPGDAAAEDDGARQDRGQQVGDLQDRACRDDEHGHAHQATLT